MKKQLIFGTVAVLLLFLISACVSPKATHNTPEKITKVGEQNRGSFDPIINQEQPTRNIEMKTPKVSSDEPLQVEDVSDYPEDKLVYNKNAPIYVTFYAHNEDTWIAKVNTKQNYEKYRNGLLDRAELLNSYDVDWDWQSDQPVIEAMLEFEDDPILLEQTHGMNILQYLESLGVSFDPHVHTNNLADVAYLIEKLGVGVSSVIGGTKVLECGTEYLGFLNWDDWNSGIWRPGNKDKFYSHSPKNDIIYIGEGYPHDTLLLGTEHASGSTVYSENLQYIKELAAKIKNGEVPTGTKDGKKFMYTASIHFRDTDVVTDGGQSINTIEGLTEILNTLQRMKENKEVIIMNYTQVAEVWSEEYNEVPWRYDLFDFSFYDKVRIDTEEECSTKGPTLKKH